jgi:hypothetical protein
MGAFMGAYSFAGRARNGLDYLFDVTTVILEKPGWCDKTLSRLFRDVFIVVQV